MKKSNITYDILYKSVKSYIDDENELNMITKAYKYAFEKHLGQKRHTGEDYIIHPLSVAQILTEIYADYECLSAALLHDVLEDCGVSKEEMVHEFGENITNLVEGVTKINKLNFSGITEAMNANHRKILVGLSEDVRVIIVKLADRLHNMRTLYVLPPKKQKEKAKETLDILIPIAHRLGMNKIKSELEDLSLRYYKPDIYFDIAEKLNKTKAERDSIVLEMQKKVSDLLNQNHIKHEIKGRAKSIFSIYKKLDKGKKFDDIYDLLALRVFVDTKQECYQALGYIHSKYRPIPRRFKDYIAMPKSNMYQSLHTTVFGIDGYLFEIQIRTYEMDRVAENGIASHWSYKEHGSNKKADMQNEMEKKLQFFRTIMEMREEETDDKDFVESVKEDSFRDLIYVFTPKGDVIELPKGSTPIDFAYRVHSDIGDHTVGAIVNEMLVPLDYKLKDDDVVKINTNKNSMGPNYEWLNIVKTPQARNKIRAYFNKLDKDENIRQGEELLQKELRKRKIPFTDFLNVENVKKIKEEFKIQDIKELYINLSNNKILPSTIYNIIYNESESINEKILKNATNSNTKKDINVGKTDIYIEGISNIKTNIASCCKPVPGEKIIGYITKGKGITIHKINCSNVSSLNERLINVYWNTVTSKKYPASILVHCKNDKDVLLNIISKSNSLNVTVNTIRTINNSDDMIYNITVLVENIEKLLKFMNEIKLLNNVIDVERSVG